MELSFILTAALRRWWLILGFALFGVVAVSAVSSTEPGYESNALLGLTPSSSANVNDFFDPDRYIAGQITVLRSGELAERVAATLTDGDTSTFTAADVLSMTEAEQLPGTNVVRVGATSSDRQVAQLVAQTYADEYIGLLRNRAEEVNAADIADLALREEELLAAVNESSREIADAVDEYIAQNTPDDGSTIQLPPLSALAPEAEAARQVRMAELNGVLDASTDLGLRAARVNSEIVSNADAPLAPVGGNTTLLNAFAAVFGAALGLAVTTVWAATSKTVNDDQEASEIIGLPISGNASVPPIADLGLEHALTDPPTRHLSDVERLAVLCETTGADTTPLVIAVAGSSRGIGVSSLCVALAERFASVGASVALVDGDGLCPDLSLLARSGDAGISALLDPAGPHGHDVFTALTNRVSLLGIGSGVGVRLRATAVAAVVDAARAHADVVVIDAGPMLESGSARQFLSLADVAVVALPHRGERADNLRETFARTPTGAEKLIVTRVRLSRRAGAHPWASRLRPTPAGPTPSPTIDPAERELVAAASTRRSRWGRGRPLHDDDALLAPATPDSGTGDRR